MATISDLISLDINPEDQLHRKEKVTPLSFEELLVYSANAQPSRKYEFDVFNFLLRNKDTLGIQTVFKFENLFIDGAILLDDGKTRLAVEIKLRMNWTKACQAGWQLKHFITRTQEAKANPVSGAIVFFEEFQGDGWHVKADCRLLQNGWNHWYEYHSKVEGRRVDLFRMCQGEIEHYGAALSASLAKRIEQMSNEEREVLYRRLSPSADPPTQ